MEQLTRKLDETFNSGDKEVRTWFLVRHNFAPFILCGFYAIFSSVIGPAIMKNRKPFKLRKTMVAFNFFIVATYSVCVTIILWNLPKVTRKQFCEGDVVRKGDLSYTMIRTFWVLYLLKYLEFFDTVFFILRKKQNLITFLHVMHHTIVPILGWIIFRTEKSGFQCVLILLNSFVHIIMYSYYGLAAMGPQVRKYLWWKKYLTQLQMIQFMLIIVFVTVVAPLSGCSMVNSSYIIDILFAPLFLYLFYQFYATTFVPKKTSSLTNGVAQKESLTNGEKKRELITNGEAKKESLTNGERKRELVTNGMAKKKSLTNGEKKRELVTNGGLKKD